MNNRTSLNRTRRSGRAPAEISQNNFAGLGKRIARIEAGEDDWNLAGDSGSIPCHRFSWCRTRVLGFQQKIVSKFLSHTTLGKILFGIRNRDDCPPPCDFQSRLPWLAFRIVQSCMGLRFQEQSRGSSYWLRPCKSKHYLTL